VGEDAGGCVVVCDFILLGGGVVAWVGCLDGDGAGSGREVDVGLEGVVCGDVGDFPVDGDISGFVELPAEVLVAVGSSLKLAVFSLKRKGFGFASRKQHQRNGE